MNYVNMIKATTRDTFELTIDENYIKQNQVYFERHEGRILGYYSYWPISMGKVKLDNLFIAPDHIGIGKKLLADFLDRVKKEGYQGVVLDADPHAESFYAKFGFEVVGKLESTISGRFLPVMELRISV